MNINSQTEWEREERIARMIEVILSHALSFLAGVGFMFFLLFLGAWGPGK